MKSMTGKPSIGRLPQTVSLFPVDHTPVTIPFTWMTPYTIPFPNWLIKSPGTGRSAPVFVMLERILVFAGFMQLLTGIVIYAGGCQATT